LGRRLFLLALSLAGAAHAQFDLVLGDGTPAPPAYDLGHVYIGETAAAYFRLRNRSAAPATLSTLTVAGVGFTVTAPAVPVGIPAEGAIDLTVNFRATDTGVYSAVLSADGISILLTAGVVPGLTYRVDSGGGLVPLATLDFGSVVRGSVAQRRVTLRNDTSAILIVPAISVQGAGFSLGAPLPSGVALQPQQGGEFTVIFQPPAAGARQGTLAIGDHSYPLLGTGTDPPLPRPSVAIDLHTAASAQQGTLIIRYDAPAQTAGTGMATLDFRGPSDPAIAFAAGGRNASFAITPGDTQAVLPFQTGTTAGTLTFSVQVGQVTGQESVTIAAAQAAVSAAQGMRSNGAIEIRVTGFDNTRTLGALSFTFYDGAGKAIASSHSDAAGDFARYFAGSDLGGVFLLRAVFPVSGDASQVASCEVALTNAAGTVGTRVLLP
jgi:hypothetical protein